MDRGDNSEERSTRRESGESRRRYRSRSRSRERDRGHYSRRRERSRSRDRDRYSARSRSRDRDRDRERSRSRDRDRDRSTSSRHRDRSRSQERRRERDDKYSSRNKYDDEDEPSKSWEHRGRRSRDGDRWHRDSPEEKDGPSPVLMLRNLKEAVRKEDISRTIGTGMSYVKDIRLVQRSWRDQGNQGFAFLEFYKPQDAARWLEQNKTTFKVLGSMVDVEFSHHKQIIEKKSISEDRDWSCFKCGTLNFARRRMCMTCDCSRGESESLHADVREGRLSNNADERRLDTELEGRNPPSNVLIFRGMDALSDESSVRSAIDKIISLPLKDVRLIRDKATNTSRGFCFVELNTIDEAKQLLEVIQNQYPAFFVDGRRLIVNFARQMNQPSGKTVSSSVASAAIEQAQWSMQTLALMRSSAQSQGAQQQPQVTQSSVQQAIQQGDGGDVTSQAQATSQSGLTTSSTSTTSGQAQQDQLPSTYSYDSTSGFYYDSATGLYYDPKTQYHYNSQTGLYCYYDPQQQTYVSVDQQGNAVPANSTTSSATTTSATDTSATATTTKSTSKKNVVTSSNVSSAKKIAKDMERWAKSVNAAKAVQQQQLQATVKAEAQVATPAPELLVPNSLHSISQSITDVSSRSGIALTAALRESDDERPPLAAHAADVVEPVTTRLSTPTAGADNNPAHTDWNQLACLLCKRKFPSKEVLIKHQQFSELHKQNLAKEKAQADLASEVKYRDRAKERRAKYGSPAIVPGWKKRLEREMASEPGHEHEPPIPYEQPTVEGLKEDNIGSKMLQAMGWSEGQGLGKSNQGIIEPIKAEQRQVGAGLGAPGSKLLYSSGGTYRDTLKQLTRARYDGAFS